MLVTPLLPGPLQLLPGARCLLQLLLDAHGPCGASQAAVAAACQTVWCGRASAAAAADGGRPAALLALLLLQLQVHLLVLQHQLLPALGLLLLPLLGHLYVDCCVCGLSGWELLHGRLLASACHCMPQSLHEYQQQRSSVDNMWNCTSRGSCS
jgi:hypothetical protein